VSTRRERLIYLIAKVDELADQIQGEGREDEVIRLAEQLDEDTKSVRPLGDVEWHALLPKERERALPAYYLTLRAELVALDREGEEQPKEQRLSWLDGAAPKTLNLLVGLGTLVQFGHEVLHAAGVLAHEPLTGERGERSTRDDPLV
jgi:hypothetical protein